MSAQPKSDPLAAAMAQWSAAWGPASASRVGAVRSIMRVQQILLARLNERLGRFGLTYARYEALMLLHHSEEGALSIGKVADLLRLHRTSAGALIEGLQSSGLARRTGHPTDRRTSLASITDRGRDVAVAATGALHEIAFGTTPLQVEEVDSIFATLRWIRLNARDFEAVPQPG